MNNFVPDFLEVLTEEGWIPINKYVVGNRVLLLNYNYKSGYAKPKVLSSQNFCGTLLELETEGMKAFMKPSSKVFCNDKIMKAKEIHKGDRLNKRYMWNRIEKIDQGEWEGKLWSFFFGEDLLMPIKFEFDYWLLAV